MNPEEIIIPYSEFTKGRTPIRNTLIEFDNSYYEVIAYKKINNCEIRITSFIRSLLINGLIKNVKIDKRYNFEISFKIKNNKNTLKDIISDNYKIIEINYNWMLIHNGDFKFILSIFTKSLEEAQEIFVDNFYLSIISNNLAKWIKNERYTII